LVWRTQQNEFLGDIMSGMPWDDAKVKRNLETIAVLQNGDKLSVLKTGAIPTEPRYRNLGKSGRGLREFFDRQRGGFWTLKRNAERTRKGETILNDLQYRQPLLTLFAKAAALAIDQTHEVDMGLILRAYQGLSRMRQTYLTGHTLAHRRKMNEIISEIQPLLPKLNAERYVILRGNITIDFFKSAELHDLNIRFCKLLDQTGKDALTGEQDAAHFYWLFLYPAMNIDEERLKLNPVAYRDHPLYIENKGTWISVRSVLRLELTSLAACQVCKLSEDPNNARTRIHAFDGTQLGITKFVTSFTMAVQRRGTQIAMELKEAKLFFKGR